MLTDDKIQQIVESQTEVSYTSNGIFIVQEQMKHAVKQALLLNDGETITLPKGGRLVPVGVPESP